MKKYKVGDWVYFEFKLRQVKDIKGEIFTLTDGFCEVSGPEMPERVVPLSIEAKVFADTMLSMYEDFYRKHRGRLSYTGGIIWKMSEIWLEACRANDPTLLDQARAFLRVVGQKLDDIAEIQGVRIFRS